ncbi:MAG: 4Fe-4S dicluster domain-containing protein [Ruminococcaceae bacterium]|nr:4Fe-4S dicluster domain-containing protein [Oscillospiraceae bacterium]
MSKGQARSNRGHGATSVLPAINEDQCYEMRLESIGGLGANLCGKLLGEIGAYRLGLNAAAFSSYGSEKRGSPVKAFVRFCASDREILCNSPVERPHLLALFHHALARTMPVTAGLGKESTAVINTASSPRAARKELSLAASTVYTVDALALARESKSRVNVVMLGAIVRACGFIPLDAAKKQLTDTLGKKYPTMLEANLLGLTLGFERTSFEHFPPDNAPHEMPFEAPTVRWGYENAPIGGINPHFGNSVRNDLSPSRQGVIPLFLPEKCIHCGLCDSTCPDMVFQFTEGEYRGKPAMLNRGLDYLHCKGCLRCVDVCPTEALVRGEEREHGELHHFVYNKDLLVTDIDFTPAGADPTVTGEAYLDEKREDGGWV